MNITKENSDNYDHQYLFVIRLVSFFGCFVLYCMIIRETVQKYKRKYENNSTDINKDIRNFIIHPNYMLFLSFSMIRILLEFKYFFLELMLILIFIILNIIGICQNIFIFKRKYQNISNDIDYEIFYFFIRPYLISILFILIIFLLLIYA